MTQELTNLIKKPLLEPTPPGYYTLIIFDSLTVLFAFAVSLAYRFFLEGALSVLFVIFSFICLCAFSVVESFVAKNGIRRFVVAVIEGVVMVVPFYDTPISILAGAFAGVVFFLVLGQQAARSEIESNLKIQFYRTARVNTGKIAIAVVLFAVLVYLPRVTPESVFVSENNFNGFFRWTADTIKHSYPNIDLGGTIQQFAGRMTDSQIEELKKKDDTFSSLSSAKQSELFEQSVQSITENIKALIGMDVRPTDSVSRTAYLYIISKLNLLQAKLGIWFLVGWALIVAFAVYNVGFLIVLPTLLFCFLVYDLLIGLKVITIKQENATRDYVSF